MGAALSSVRSATMISLTTVRSVLTCARITFIVIVSLFSLIVAMLVATALFAPHINTAFTMPLNEKAQQLMSSMGMPLDTPEQAGHLVTVIRPVLAWMLGGSLFYIFIGILGCIAIMMTYKILKIIYIAFLVISLLGLVTLFIVLRNGRTMLNQVHDVLLEELNKKYLGIDANNSFTQMFNTIMISANCCGLDGYEDFVNTAWSRIKTITLRNLTLPKAVEMPLPCCRFESLEELAGKVRNYPSTVQNNIQGNQDLLDSFQCANKNSTMNNKGRGCYDLIWDRVEKVTHSNYFLIVFIVIFVLSTANIIMNCVSLWLV